MQTMNTSTDKNAAITNHLAAQIRKTRQEIILNLNDNLDYMDQEKGEQLDKKLKSLKRRLIASRNV